MTIYLSMPEPESAALRGSMYETTGALNVKQWGAVPTYDGAQATTM